MDNTQQIIEGNKLIAEFMGAKKYSEYKGSYYSYEGSEPPTTNSSYHWSAITMEYHFNLEWQIYACKKFKQLTIVDKLARRTWFDLIDELNEYLLNLDTEEIFLQLVKCIKWYNENTLQK